MSSGKKERASFAIPVEMMQWLASSAESHSLKNPSKALRCCINCVALGDVEMEEENDDDCTRKFNYLMMDFELTTDQIKWVDNTFESLFAQKGEASTSEVIRCVIGACMKAEESVVFGVVRCSSKVAACVGAQDAVDTLTKKYGADGVVVKEDIELLK